MADWIAKDDFNSVNLVLNLANDRSQLAEDEMRGDIVDLR